MEKVLKEYCDILYSQMPIFFKYLNVIRVYSMYIIQISDNLNEKISLINYYETDFDALSSIEIAKQLVGQIDNSLVSELDRCIQNGTIDINGDEGIISCLTVTNGHPDITIRRTNTIEDVFSLIHEFFHYIHIKQFDNNITDQNWYFFTECFAMIGELYTIFIALQIDVLHNDTIEYLKKYFQALSSQANDTLLTSTILGVYDQEQGISEKNFEDYIARNNLSKDFMQFAQVINDLDDFTFHDSSTYTFGFFIALKISERMIKDEKYKDKVYYLLTHIRDYDLETLLLYLEIDAIINDEEYIYDTANFALDFSEGIFNNESKRLCLEKR